jgi:membrane associated rhomboid family serine protease
MPDYRLQTHTVPNADSIYEPDLRRSGGRIGSLRLVSVNTWLIVVNVAVFVLGHVIFASLIASDRKDGKPGSVTNVLIQHVSAGRAFRSDATPEQQARGVVDRSITRAIDGSPNILYHPIYDPHTVMTDQLGRPLVTLDGTRVLREIGAERFTNKPILDAWGHFSTGKAFLELQVWRFITFQFLHFDLTHLIFNMLGLWFVGGLVEEYLGRKRYLGFYLLCGLFGGIAYLVLNLLGYVLVRRMPGVAENVPALLFEDIYTPLIGASAGVFGVLMAAAYIAPTSMVDVLLVIPMRLRTAVYIFFGLAFINLFRGGSNAGGDAAHVGGALAGAYFIRRLHLIRDVLDLWSDSRETNRSKRTDASLREIDRVLDKVRDEGIASLTDAEKRTLKAAASGLSGSHALGVHGR